MAIGEISGTVKVGNTVYLCGENYCLERIVTSLQIEGKQFEEIDLGVPTEVGLMFDGKFKKNGKMLTLKPLASPLSEPSTSSEDDSSDQPIHPQPS